MPGESDAAWLAHFAARRLMAHSQDGASGRDALRRALGEAEKSFTGLRRRAPKHNHENPYASMMFVCAGEGGFEAFWFGDCAALVKHADGRVEIVGDAFDKRAAEARRVKMLAQAKGLAPAAGTSRPEFLSALRAARNSVNTEKGGWLFGPNPKAAEHVQGASHSGRARHAGAARERRVPGARHRLRRPRCAGPDRMRLNEGPRSLGPAAARDRERGCGRPQIPALQEQRRRDGGAVAAGVNGPSPFEARCARTSG